MPNPRLRTLLFPRKWAKKDWAIATLTFAFAFAIIVFALTLFSDTRTATFHGSPVDPRSGLRSPTHLVPLTLLRNANDKGAFCLDGSIPGYHFEKGFGSGSHNWLLHIEGGGWCNTVASCSRRKMTALGSSKYMETEVPFSGMLSSDPSQNPGEDTLL